MDEEKARYERARARVHKIKEFYGHLVVYIIVNVGLIIINLVTSSYPWFIWPLLGWGIGLTMHGFNVFGVFGFFGPEWEENKIKELMAKDKDNSIQEKEQS